MSYNIFKGKYKNLTIYTCVVFALFGLLLTFGSGNNLIHWIGAKVEISRQERLIREYKEQIEEMDKRIRMLESDRDSLEKFARERFLLSKPGEDVYILEDRR